MDGFCGFCRCLGGHIMRSSTWYSLRCLSVTVASHSTSMPVKPFILSRQRFGHLLDKVLIFIEPGEIIQPLESFG